MQWFERFPIISSRISFVSLTDVTSSLNLISHLHILALYGPQVFSLVHFPHLHHCPLASTLIPFALISISYQYPPYAVPRFM